MIFYEDRPPSDEVWVLRRTVLRCRQQTDFQIVRDGPPVLLPTGRANPTALHKMKNPPKVIPAMEEQATHHVHQQHDYQ